MLLLKFCQNWLEAASLASRRAIVASVRTPLNSPGIELRMNCSTVLKCSMRSWLARQAPPSTNGMPCRSGRAAISSSM
jgi:hypothetical protein